MSGRARAWLASRAGPVPPALQDRMENALDTVADSESVSAALAGAAHACLRDALAIGDDRDAALHLLAADALITYACEAAVDANGPALDEPALEELALDELARTNAPERLSHMFGLPDSS